MNARLRRLEAITRKKTCCRGSRLRGCLAPRYRRLRRRPLRQRPAGPGRRFAQAAGPWARRQEQGRQAQLRGLDLRRHLRAHRQAVRSRLGRQGRIRPSPRSTTIRPSSRRCTPPARRSTSRNPRPSRSRTSSPRDWSSRSTTCRAPPTTSRTSRPSPSRSRWSTAS